MSTSENRIRVHALYHASFEGLGALAPWLETHGCQLGETRLYAGERLPAAADIDWLIVMGGPMSVHDEATLPWLREEKQIIVDCIRAGKTVLGFCLGAQLIAHVSGAKVSRNAYKEIGWFPVEATLGGANLENRKNWLVDKFPEVLTTFHWHGETFELPEGALHLGASEGCANQGFILGDRVVGLQFHPEMRREDIMALRDHCADELKSALAAGTSGAPYVQTNDALLGRPEYYEANRFFLEELMSGLRQRAANLK
jgi:GMP synthase-like glutamine amidotransferase